LRSKTACCDTFESTSSSNTCCLGNHPSALDLVVMECSFVYWSVLFSWGFCRWMGSCLERTNGAVSPQNAIQRDCYGSSSVLIWYYGKQNKPRQSEWNSKLTAVLWGNRGSWGCAISEPWASYHISKKQTKTVLWQNNIDVLEWLTR
jgi:hypothetical protein